MDKSFSGFFEGVLRSSGIIDAYLARELEFDHLDFKMGYVPNDQIKCRTATLEQEVPCPDGSKVPVFRNTTGTLKIVFAGGEYFGNSDLEKLLQNARDGKAEAGINISFTICEAGSNRWLYELRHIVGEEVPAKIGDEDFILNAHRYLGNGSGN